MDKSLVVFYLFILTHNQIAVLPLTLGLNESVARAQQFSAFKLSSSAEWRCGFTKIWDYEENKKLPETMLLKPIHENRNQGLNLTVIFSFC